MLDLRNTALKLCLSAKMGMRNIMRALKAPFNVRILPFNSRPFSLTRSGVLGLDARLMQARLEPDSSKWFR